MTEYKKWAVGDVVVPGDKKPSSYDYSTKYATLDYSGTQYVVTSVHNNPSGAQSVSLKVHKKGPNYDSAAHAGEGRWYSADGLKNPPSGPATAKENLATAILGNVTKGPIASETKVPTAIVVNLKTGQVVYTEYGGRGTLANGDVLSGSTYDKTDTMYGPNSFVQKELKKDPLGVFAVYDLSRIGKVSEIKVSWS